MSNSDSNPPISSAGAITTPMSPRLQRAPEFDANDDRTWGVLLTRMLRENFESKGVEIVRQEILDGRYSDDGKKFAALVWLKEKGEQDRITARNRFRLTIAIAGLAALASVLKLFLK